VDDLNILSFLDTLRELVIDGKRQVFFSTASNRIANLFARKFDFLGKAFKQFALSRGDT
jgi:exonuclease SbcC